uniref:Cl-channel voltage-gated family domain protein n=1 Tax=Rhizobium rhizogenes TaxID=359 RepID=A0A7S5DQF9_RHIRH|nr:hypothetical protein [Rhizobium rhizogenes]QCL10029.1 cl-channel voltage-gated family domain protein [Rhizobium rhizogenes]
MAEIGKPGLDHLKSAGSHKGAPSAQGPRQDHGKIHHVRLLCLSRLALVLRILTGLDTVLFHDLMALLHDLFFRATLTIAYDGDVFIAPSRCGVLPVGAPALAAIVVTFPIGNFAPKAKNYSVPRAMDAIYHRDG